MVKFYYNSILLFLLSEIHNTSLPEDGYSPCTQGTRQRKQMHRWPMSVTPSRLPSPLTHVFNIYHVLDNRCTAKWLFIVCLSCGTRQSRSLLCAGCLPCAQKITHRKEPLLSCARKIAHDKEPGTRQNRVFR